MSENTGAFGFGKYVPGFDFLQNLAKGASQAMPQMPNLSSWVAPTLNVEELEKRITELKAVHFWLEQNGKALGATIQALEVQKMTLATLRGMNFEMGEMAEALKVRTEDAMAGMRKMTQGAGGAARAGAEKAAKAAKPKQPAGDDKAAEGKTAEGGQGNGKAEAAGAPIDPLQWWGALTQQFQEIAANAMKDAAQKTTGGIAKAATDGMTAAATSMVNTAVAPRKSAARKAPARKAKAKSKTG